jgi:guanylate kinase
MTSKLFSISAPSGCGKSTLIKKLLLTNRSLKQSISFTTREPRESEVDGQDYFFVSKKNFTKMINTNVFIEYAEVYGNYYGTHKKWLQDELNKNLSHILLELDVQGALSIKKIFPESVRIFINPPNLDILEKRLYARGKDSKKQIKIRLAKANEEISIGSNFEYVIINEQIDECLNTLNKIIINKSNHG